VSGLTLPVVTQDPRFGGGLRSQTRAFCVGVTALGWWPALHYISVVEGLSPRLKPRVSVRAERHDELVGVAYPAVVPELDVLNQASNALRIGRRLRREPAVWVVGTTAPYGAPALAARRPYACWLGTGLESEWSSRRQSLPASRRLALAINRPGLLALERQVIRSARLVYATSPSSRHTIAHAGDLPLDAVSILPIPIDLERFKPLTESDWLTGFDRPTIVFVGRGSDPRKNLPLLLDAFRLLRARIPSVRLRLVGEEPRAALPEGAEAVGHVLDVARELAQAAIFVLPSLQEGFGIVVAEALAAGVPAVVTPCGGPEDLVRDSGGGVVLEGFGADELATTLEELLSDEVRLLAARRSGRAYVEREHAPARLVELLADPLEQLRSEGSSS
jgi:glycosyltransferase involved in cell wall biosynthesis